MKTSGRSGVTLIELLVVFGVIAILVSLLLPAVQTAREAARKTQCRNSLRQIGLALALYHDAHLTFPINTTYNYDVMVTGLTHSWIQGLLPFIEQQALFDEIDPGASIVMNRSVAEQILPALFCPSDTHSGRMTDRAPLPSDWNMGVTNYKACAGSNWGWGGFDVSSSAGRFLNDTDGLSDGNGLICEGRSGARVTRIKDVTDGTSQTFAIGEAVPEWSRWNWWYYNNGSTATCGIPMNYQKTHLDWNDWTINYGFMSRHYGGSNFGMGDGSTRFVSENIDLDVYHALATIQGHDRAAE